MLFYILGSIIAIQDVDQHMYIVAEGAERNYHLAGAMHYSVAGETALFRVCNLYSHYNSCMKFANSYSTIISQLKLIVLTKSAMNK